VLLVGGGGGGNLNTLYVKALLFSPSNHYLLVLMDTGMWNCDYKTFKEIINIFHFSKLKASKSQAWIKIDIIDLLFLFLFYYIIILILNNWCPKYNTEYFEQINHYLEIQMVSHLNDHVYKDFLNVLIL